MGNDSIGDIDREVVAGIARAPLRDEDEIPRAVIGRSRLRGWGHQAKSCNRPEQMRLH